MPLITPQVFARAVENVAKWGDTDVFPFPVENHIFNDRADSVTKLLTAIASGFDDAIIATPVHNYSTLAPVGYTGFRWATQIDPAWNAYLLSLVLSLAPEIEESRIHESQNRIFSYRFQVEPADSLFKQDAWRNFQNATRELAEEYEYVVSVDISDFYSRIYHHRLENALRPVDPGAMKTAQIMKILGQLSNGTSYGLPVGGPAARILAELVLNSVDHLLLNEPSTKTFCRYADDYRFFVKDIQGAYQAIGFLSEKLLRNEGMSLQKSKTRIMTSNEYLSMLEPVEPPPGSAAKFLGLHVHYDPYSDTAEEDYEQLKQKIDEFDVQGLLRAELNKGRVHTALTKRLITALQFMEPTPRMQAAYSLLDNIETLAPVIPQVMLAVRSAVEDLDDRPFTDQVHERIRSLVNESHYVTKIDLNLSYMVRVLASQYSIETEQLLISLYNSPNGFTRTQSLLIQRDVILIMAGWRRRFWLSDLKNYVTTLHPWLQRAFLIASYSLGDEGHHWRGSAKASFSPLDEVARDWVAEKSQRNDWRVPV